MALLLLQDCLIDLSAPIGKNVSISLDGGLVNKMVENDCFNEDDSDKLLEEIKKFIKEDYKNGVIYLSSVFYNIPFFEERLIEETRLKVKSIFHYVRNEDDNTTEIKLLEIGKYFRCETTFDYQQNKRISFKIESCNLNQKLSEIFEPDACYPLADIETIVKLNSYAEENCVKNSEE